MKQSQSTITSNVEISPTIRLMWIEASDIATSAQPGQFITVRCEGLILRRPFSIHQVSRPLPSKRSGGVGLLSYRGNPSPHHPLSGEGREGEVALLFRVVGQGTLWLSQHQTGDKIDILGPLGKGFSIPSVIARNEAPRQFKNLLLLAGGIGIAPLVFLAQHALSSSRHSVTLIHGASTATQLYPQQLLPKEVQFIPVTEDGTMGQKAMVTDILPDFLSWADQVYACGPINMYRAMALTLNPSPLKGEGKGEGEERSEESKLKKCQVSLEVRMGCGIGACYGCTINTRKGLKQVCCDGPIFELDDIIWEEVRI